DVFRISVYVPEKDLQFNEFLVRDEEPLLYHTGQIALFPEVHAAVKTLINPEHLRWIGFSHFESDECGALNRWLDIAPKATTLTGQVAAATCINDYAVRPPRVLIDGERIQTGRHTFEFLATPHVPHGWGASLLFDHTEKILFCSDLLLQHGNPAALSDSVLEDAVDALEKGQQGPFHDAIPYTSKTGSIFARLAALAPQTLAIMHGASFKGDAARVLLQFEQELARVQAS
ncbi:MAG: MBL fold metallo-hydrolase, partial [Herbaspirillum sp.]